MRYSLLSQWPGGDHSCRARRPRDPTFFVGLFLSGLDYGLLSWRRACYRLVRLFLIPVESPRDRHGKSVSGNRRLGPEIRADYGRFFFCREIVLARDWCCVLLRAGWFFPGGPAIAAVMVSERGGRVRTRVDAGAYTSAHGTRMAHFYCLTVDVPISERPEPSA